MPAWCATGDAHRDLAAQAEGQARDVTAGEAYISAALCYHFGKFVFQDYHDEYMAAGRQSIAAPAGCNCSTQAASASKLRGRARRWSATCAARPAQAPAAYPAAARPRFGQRGVLLLGERLSQARAGDVRPRRPRPGRVRLRTRIRPDYEAAVSAALDVLMSADQRVGLAGVSLGGYYAPRAAAFEPRVKAAVGIAGPWNFAECWPHLPSLTRAAFRYHSGAAARAVAVANANQLTWRARPSESPAAAHHHGKLDRIIPWEQAEKMDKAGAKAELVMYENGNHVCNNIPYLYRPLAPIGCASSSRDEVLA